MTVHRQLFEIDTDTGTQGDTGPSFTGKLVQFRWVPTTGDTGDNLDVSLLPKEGDTGDGFAVWTPENLSLGLTKLDTGRPYYAAGDRLRAKVTPAGAACVGRLYVWHNDD